MRSSLVFNADQAVPTARRAPTTESAIHPSLHSYSYSCFFGTILFFLSSSLGRLFTRIILKFFSEPTLTSIAIAWFSRQVARQCVLNTLSITQSRSPLLILNRRRPKCGKVSSKSMTHSSSLTNLQSKNEAPLQTMECSFPEEASRTNTS